MNGISFTKMHGLGNDFVVFDGRRDSVVLDMDDATAARIADRKTGVGCDQLGIMRHSKNWQETTFLEMYNCSGGVVEACGNMTRCVADILMTEDGTDNVVLETLGGSLNCWKEASLDRHAPEGEGESSGRRECRWQRDQLPDAIRDLVLDDQRLRNDICWSVFDC